MLSCGGGKKRCVRLGDKKNTFKKNWQMMHTKSWLREATTHRRVEALSDSSNTASSCLLLNLS